MSAPPVYTDELVAKTTELLGRYAGVQPSPGDLADGLVRVFARLAGVAVDRVNAAPDKNFLAFLDMVGLELQPPQAARAPVTFHLAAGTAVDAVVPVRTRVAAPPQEGETQPTVYETELELVATPVQLVAVATRDERDRYGVHGVPSGDAIEPFTATTPIRHALYLAHDEFARALPKQIFLRFFPQPESPGWIDALEWSCWSGTDWLPLDAVRDDAVVTLNRVPPIPSREVGGIAGAWLRAALPTTIPVAGVEADDDGVPQTLVVDAVAPEAVVAGDRPVAPGRAYVPFDRTVGGALLWLASDETLLKPGATAVLTVELDPTQIVRPQAGMTLGWQLLVDGEWSDVAGLVDGTNALAQPGSVTFAVPEGVTRSVGPDGSTRAWLRVQTRAATGSSTYADDGRPVIESLAFSYRWTLPRTDGIAASVSIDREPTLPADAAFANQAPVDLNKDFLPFGAEPQPNDTLYLACDDAFRPPKQSVTIHVTLTNVDPKATPAPASAQNGLALAWEYWDAAASAWLDLGVEDGSNAFTADGQDVTFTPPPTMGAVDVNGRLERWIRVRIAKGDYGRPAHYEPTGATDPAVPNFRLVASTLAPPSIKSLRIGYDYEFGPAPPEAIATESDFEISDRTGESGPLVLFSPPADARPTLHLVFDRPFSNRTMTLYLGVAPPRYTAGEDDAAGSPPSVVWEYYGADGWQRLQTRDETEALTSPGLLTFVGPADMEQRDDLDLSGFWLRARWERGDYVPPARLARVLTNTTWATNAPTVLGEVLGSGTSEPGQTVRTTRTPVLPGQHVEVRELDAPTGAELAEIVADEGADAVTVVRDAAGRPLEVWVRWHCVVDFNDSGPRSRHYVLDRASGVVTFGDGVRGLPPPVGRASIRAASYRTGGGVGGNRPAGAITLIQTAIPYVDGVVNHEPADGGAAAETLDALVARGPRRLRHGGRAVAAADFEDLAHEATTEVARALAVPATGSQDAGRVVVVIVPQSAEAQPVPTLELIRRVGDYLAARTTPVYDLRVAGPGWTRVTVTAEIVPESLERAADVESAALQRLDAFLHPLSGGDGGGWPFGRRPRRSDLVALLEAVPGVDHVRSLSVDEAAVDAPPVPGAVLVFSGTHRVTVGGDT